MKIKWNKGWLLPVLLLAVLPAGCGAPESNAPESGDEAAQMLREPPALMVSCGDGETAALLGTYSWTWTEPDGSGVGVEADSVQVLAARDNMIPLPLSAESTVTLRFAEEPDTVSVLCWSTDCWERTDVPGEAVEADRPEEKDGTAFALTARPDCVYEVLAAWEGRDGWGGTAYYGFYTQAP